MEDFVAGIFPTIDEALAAHGVLDSLPQQGALRIEFAAVYGRDTIGDLALNDTPTGNANDLEFADGGAGQEALAELSESIPEGSFALLAHVFESDPAIVDNAMVSAGGVVQRRSLGQLNSAVGNRLTAD